MVDSDLPSAAEGVPPGQLSDAELVEQLESLHRTRHETLLRGPDQALVHHTERQNELEAEFLRRFPDRDVDPQRLRPE